MFTYYIYFYFLYYLYYIIVYIILLFILFYLFIFAIIGKVVTLPVTEEVKCLWRVYWDVESCLLTGWEGRLPTGFHWIQFQSDTATSPNSPGPILVTYLTGSTKALWVARRAHTFLWSLQGMEGVWSRSTGQKSSQAGKSWSFWEVAPLEGKPGPEWSWAALFAPAISLPFSHLACWPSQWEAASASYSPPIYPFPLFCLCIFPPPLVSVSIALEYPWPFQPRANSELHSPQIATLCFSALFPKSEDLTDWAQLCSGPCHWPVGACGPEILRQVVLPCTHLWPICGLRG